MEFAVMTLLFWILMFIIVMVSLWVVKEVLFIICLLDGIKKGNRYYRDLFELDYQKIFHILKSVGYFDDKK